MVWWDGHVPLCTPLCASWILTEKDILGQFCDVLVSFGLWFPRLSLFVCYSSCDAALFGEADGTWSNLLFWKARPVGTRVPKTVSDGQACGREVHFDVREQHPPKHRTILSAPNTIQVCAVTIMARVGFCQELSRKRGFKRLRKVAEIFPELIIIESSLRSEVHSPLYYCSSYSMATVSHL